MWEPTGLNNCDKALSPETHLEKARSNWGNVGVDCSSTLCFCVSSGNLSYFSDRYFYIDKVETGNLASASRREGLFELVEGKVYLKSLYAILWGYNTKKIQA